MRNGLGGLGALLVLGLGLGMLRGNPAPATRPAATKGQAPREGPRRR